MIIDDDESPKIESMDFPLDNPELLRGTSEWKQISINKTNVMQCVPGSWSIHNKVTEMMQPQRICTRDCFTKPGVHKQTEYIHC